MECLFSNFGYAIISPDGENYSTIARSEDTAWMTKHLKAYGGSGEYEGYKIGRWLKNITFSGKGYVDHPANKNSIIFNEASTFMFSQATQENPFSSNSGVLILHAEEDKTVPANKLKENSMADSDNLLKDQNSKLEAKISTLETKLGNAVEELAKSNVVGLETEVEQLTEGRTGLVQEISDLTAVNKKLTESLDEAKVKAEEAEKAKAEIETQLSEVKTAEKRALRIASLVDGGVDMEVATTKVELYKSLTDEQFEDIASDIVEAAKDKKDDKKKDKKDDKSDASKSDESNEEEDKNGEASADEKKLDELEANKEPDLNAANENKGEDKLEATRAQLSNWIRSRGIGGDVEESDDSKGDK